MADDDSSKKDDLKKEIEDEKFHGFDEELQEFGRKLRKMPGIRRLLNFVIYGLYIPPTMILKGQGKILFNPSYRKLMFDRETKTGLLEDSIFAPSLWCPNDEGTSLQYDNAVAGRYAAYDFHRREEFGKNTVNRGKGRLIAFPLDEIIDNPASKYTPSTLVEPLDLGQILQIVFPSIDELVEWELVRDTTYKEAYKRAGLYDQYRLGIELKNIGDETVYQITPKGNGLVFVATEGGEKTSEKKRELVFVPGWHGNI